MATGERIHPGPGWRLLKPGEVKPQGYEYKSPNFGWIKGEGVGDVVIAYGFPCRVRITIPHATKAIATRATVRVVAADGEVERSIRCDSGLSIRQMHAAIASFDGAVDALRNRTSVPKYIMLEIQRGENDC